MSQPPAYIIIADFSQAEANNESGRGTVNTANLDTEFTNIKAFVDAIRTNLALIQRDDAQLKDGIVNLISLSTDVKTLLLADPSTPRGDWATATSYSIKDIVTETAVTYLCNENHTSGTFATDLTAGKWIAITSAGLDAGSVKTSYESNANTNAFTDTEQSKLGAIESGATADQTGTELRTALDAESDTNILTDALLGKLNGIDAGAEVNPALMSQGEAEAGTDTNERVVSAVRVAQAIAAQRSYASQAEAEAGTNNTKMMTPLRTAQAISGGEVARTEVFTASGTYNVPEGVTEVLVTCVGGGGTGGNHSTTAGGGGGGGGKMTAIISVTGGGSETVVVGAAGASCTFGSTKCVGNAGGNGTTGGSSSGGTGGTGSTTGTMVEGLKGGVGSDGELGGGVGGGPGGTSGGGDSSAIGDSSFVAGCPGSGGQGGTGGSPTGVAGIAGYVMVVPLV